ncbi:carbon catabolite repressor protein 4 homolog 4 isoform X2 [Brassica napus]|uniref:Endonuclease/exonuclease/phosphatase domain-containing protein n=1 Tax=Brassica oleracea var. oleracea TaxID=109376 RepID=A0A0D3CF72_BRAOL|nr:PREDICTED: carbon catabolite repressor protein 4 homolog 4-like isoform X2 [Brassica oleracea var. oleracea]XP_013640182.2 carbon catabolite repressor protein 4 homolog 4 isoform X2 [Brassica napus]
MFNTTSLLHLPGPILPSFTTISCGVCRKIVSRRMSTNPPMEPKVRNFESVEEADDKHSISKSDGIRFRLVSYNILAQVYVKSSLLPHSPPACLKWKARSHAILGVLKKLEADFFCLQEVDEYDSFYRKNMDSLGYSGIYIQRTGQRKRDGCAIFYKPSCAELVAKERIEYNDLLDSVKADSVQETETSNESKDSRKDSRDLNDPLVRLKRDCVGIMAAFKINKPFHQVVIVANTHLYWDPELADVKLAQAKYLLSRLDQFKTLISNEFECTPSLLLSGDFNSIPGDKVYSYLVSGNGKPAETIEEEEEAPVPLCSAYEVTRGEPKFTNCTPGFTNTLDYIFFSPSDFIKPVSILQLPEPESPDVVGFLPNNHHPSDHLPIGAEFEISRNREFCS